jgi:NitT/TauT family transport system substrate-binding protein
MNGFARRRFMVGTGLAGMAAIAPQISLRAQGAPTKFRLINWGPVTADFGEMHIGKGENIFQAAGIDLEVVSAQGAGDAMRQLMAGNGHAAMLTPEPLFFGIDQGAAVKAIYNFYPKGGLFEVATLKKNGISKIADLKGKKVGVLGMASTTRYTLDVMLRGNGLTEKDVQLIAVGLDFTNPLVQGRIDAVSLGNNFIWDMKNRQLPPELRDELVVIDRITHYISFPVIPMCVTTDQAAKDKDLYVRFISAMNKARDRLFADPQRAAEFAAKFAIDGKDVERDLAQIKLKMEVSIDPETGKPGRGTYSDKELDQVQKYADYFTAGGTVKKKLQVRDFYTNDIAKLAT